MLGNGLRFVKLFIPRLCRLLFSRIYKATSVAVPISAVNLSSPFWNNSGWRAILTLHPMMGKCQALLYHPFFTQYIRTVEGGARMHQFHALVPSGRPPRMRLRNMVVGEPRIGHLQNLFLYITGLGALRTESFLHYFVCDLSFSSFSSSGTGGKFFS